MLPHPDRQRERKAGVKTIESTAVACYNPRPMRRVFASVMAAVAGLATFGAAGCAADAGRTASPRAFRRSAATELPGGADARVAAANVQTADAAAEPSMNLQPVGTDAGEGRDSVEPVEAASVATSDRAAEVRLRHEMAFDADPTAAALELAAALAADERYAEACAVLETAMARQRSMLLRVAHASVLRDLGQRHLAKDELRTLRGEVGAAGLSPGLLFELAEIEWLEGEAGAAASTLREMSLVHATDAWLEGHRREIDELTAEMQRSVRPSRVRVRDLLGNLRGAPLASDRIDALERLCRVEAVVDKARLSIRVQAVAVALGDDAGPVRARALQLAPADLPQAAAVGETALGDADALVRAVAAKRAGSWLGPRAAAVLFAALARETDPAAFIAEHEALAAVVGVADPLPREALQTPAARSEVVARWRGRMLP